MTEVRKRNRVREFRMMAGLSRRDLAAATGVSHETIRRIEDLPDYEPMLRVARVLAEFFHVEIPRLFTIESADPEEVAV